MALDLLELKRSFESYHILICFSGPFSQSIIEELGLALRKHMGSEAQPKSITMDVFSIYIEQTQNIRNYARKMAARGYAERDFNCATVLIGREQQHYFVASGNTVHHQDVNGLCAAVERLQQLDRKQLRTLYRERLRGQEAQTRLHTGAGLGLIDMARKASLPLDYCVTPFGDDKQFFTLVATI